MLACLRRGEILAHAIERSTLIIQGREEGTAEVTSLSQWGRGDALNKGEVSFGKEQRADSLSQEGRRGIWAHTPAVVCYTRDTIWKFSLNASLFSAT